MAAILFGLLAAAFYGAADFCGGLAARRTAVFAVTIISQLAGLLALLLILVFTHWRLAPSDLLYGVLAGICAGGGLALFYHALAVGRMGVVSPITAVLASAVPVIASLAHGEHLRLTQFGGMLIALVAIVLIAASFEEGQGGGKREIATEGVREALVAGVVIGGFILFLSRAQPASGLAILLPARTASVLVLLATAAALRGTVRPRIDVLPLIVICGVLDMAANAFFVLSARAGYVSIAAVLTGLYPASTVLLALILLRERLQRVQQLGVVLALAGVALIAA
ncbi:MAG TPA: DMT family transporter [Candidatus Tyrphobacter sp.]